MKIVDLKTFRALPVNTVFMKFEPTFFGPIEIKGETWEVDFISGELALFVEGGEQTADSLTIGSEFRFDADQFIRDGLFEDDQLFAIFDNQDIQQVIDRLKLGLK